MEDIELLIKIDKEQYEFIKQNMTIDRIKDYHALLYDICERIKNGTVLPKGYEKLFDEAEILRFLKCPKYENCDWKNCFDCNESRCINLNNVNDLVPIIEDKK